MIVLTPLIVLPMALPALRARYKWEWRKGLHYLSVAWGVALACHAPAMQVAYLVGGALAVYALDYTWGLLARTHRRDLRVHAARGRRRAHVPQPAGLRPRGRRAGLRHALRAVALPERQTRVARVLALPAPAPARPLVRVRAARRRLARALHRAIERPTTRPVWVAGPYASPYSTADEFQNLVLVASGIGITPALSVLGTLRSSRRTNLVWMCRDASLLSFYVRSCLFPSDAWTLIYYTGRRRLVLDDAQLPRTVMIFRGRPNLDCVVRELIAGIELETGLPERMVAESDQQRRSARRLFAEFYEGRRRRDDRRDERHDLLGQRVRADGRAVGAHAAASPTPRSASTPRSSRRSAVPGPRSCARARPRPTRRPSSASATSACASTTSCPTSGCCTRTPPRSCSSAGTASAARCSPRSTRSSSAWRSARPTRRRRRARARRGRGRGDRRGAAHARALRPRGRAPLDGVVRRGHCEEAQRPTRARARRLHACATLLQPPGHDQRRRARRASATLRRQRPWPAPRGIGEDEGSAPGVRARGAHRILGGAEPRGGAVLLPPGRRPRRAPTSRRSAGGPCSSDGACSTAEAPSPSSTRSPRSATTTASSSAPRNSTGRGGGGSAIAGVRGRGRRAARSA